MTTKYMKKYSTPLAVKEMQIGMTLRFHLTPVRTILIRSNEVNIQERHRTLTFLAALYNSQTMGAA
jgi:hypothetical protein